MRQNNCLIESVTNPLGLRKLVTHAQKSRFARKDEDECDKQQKRHDTGKKIKEEEEEKKGKRKERDRGKRHPVYLY